MTTSPPIWTADGSDTEPVSYADTLPAADRGLRSWLLTRDHKRIALMFAGRGHRSR